jgi:hypothetical protein
MSNIVLANASKLATALNLGGEPEELVGVLKATAFKGQVSDAQMAALLVVANQYSLNPWTKEIYAFPDKSNGIVPVVGVDGWSRIINTHPQFDGMDFQQDNESCTCIIYRKDRAHPVKVTEWMEECKRGTGPWQSHPKRMLRHKAMIQCARLAFGFVGIYEQDEAERIVESVAPKVINSDTGEIITFDLDAAKALVLAAPDKDELQRIWKAQCALANAARDVSGYEELKDLVLQRRDAFNAAIAAANVVDAEVK